jgi:hypothetical protein
VHHSRAVTGSASRGGPRVHRARSGARHGARTGPGEPFRNLAPEVHHAPPGRNCDIAADPFRRGPLATNGDGSGTRPAMLETRRDGSVPGPSGGEPAPVRTCGVRAGPVYRSDLAVPANPH